ncbi:uncharacterized protein V6R79_020782 [Siganus canaliculatus]
MSICGLVRRWETEPRERCKAGNQRRAATAKPLNATRGTRTDGHRAFTPTHGAEAAGSSLSRSPRSSGGAPASNAAIFCERMYGTTRRACSDSGWGRSLPMLSAALLLSVLGLLSGLPGLTEAKECDKACMNGQCNAATGSCVCFPGWVGDQCQHCGGRFRYGDHRLKLLWRPCAPALLCLRCSPLHLGRAHTCVRACCSNYYYYCH